MRRCCGPFCSNLDRWVKDGVAPPPSAYPRLDDGTLVPMAGLEAHIPGFTLAKAPNARPRFDYGPTIAKGIIDQVLPQALPGSYGVWCRASMRTATRWRGCACPTSPCRPEPPRDGRFVPPGRAARASCAISTALSSRSPRPKRSATATGDTRPSLSERYSDHDAYVAKVAKAAAKLRDGGYLVEEDVGRIVDQAAARTW